MSALFSKQARGQGLVEYALIFVLVAIVVVAALMISGPDIANVFSRVNSSLSNTGAAAVVPTAIPPTAIPPTSAAPPNHVPASNGVCPPGTHYYHIHIDGTTWCHLN